MVDILHQICCNVLIVQPQMGSLFADGQYVEIPLRVPYYLQTANQTLFLNVIDIFAIRIKRLMARTSLCFSIAPYTQRMSSNVIFIDLLYSTSECPSFFLN